MQRRDINKIWKLVFLLGVMISLQLCEDEVYSPNHHPEILSVGQLGYGIPIGWNDTLVCLASDEDGDDLVFEWTAPVGSLAGFGDTVIWFAPDTPATYPLEGRVTDGRGGYDESELLVHVFDYDTLYLEHERLIPKMRLPSDTLIVITNEVQYMNLWNQYHSISDGQGNPILPPEVNFDSLIVAVVSAGDGATSGCNQEVTFIDYVYSIRDSVFIQLTTQGWSEIQPGCFAEIEPRHWATLPKPGLPILFKGHYRWN